MSLAAPRLHSLAATYRGFAFYVAFPKTLHSLDRDVFYVDDPISSIRAERFLRFFAGAPTNPCEMHAS